MKVLGNVSGGAAAPAEVAILDEDDMASDSATALATQQSIKAYVDGEIADLPGNEFTPATYAGEGSVTLPNGLIMKMGRVTTSGTSRAVSYGSPFPNAVLSTVVTVEASTSLAVDTVISNKTLSSFDVFYGSAATHVNWFAIGY